jgi:hypothetical protein
VTCRTSKRKCEDSPLDANARTQTRPDNAGSAFPVPGRGVFWNRLGNNAFADSAPSKRRDCRERVRIGTLVLEKFQSAYAQQVPEPPAPGPGVPPSNVPPLPPTEIPVPDQAPPPIENPGDVPLPPITDPDVIEPGEPKPARPPLRARGVRPSSEYRAGASAPKAGRYSRNERSNLFLGSELQRSMIEANLGIPRTRTAPSRARSRADP